MKTRATTSSLVALGAAATLALTGALAAAPAQAAQPAGTVTCQTPPEGTDASTVGKQQATKFFTLLHNQDVAGFEEFLSPAFQVQNGNGTSDNHDSFLAGPLAHVKKFRLSHVRAQLDGPLLTVLYRVQATGDIKGHPYAIVAAPRLSTFSYCSGEWKLVSHGNFDPLAKR